MKMSGIITCCCVALFFSLTSVSAVQRLDSINDLKKINFGQSVSKHSLLLLYWFANAVDIRYNDEITLDFDPNNRAYGSHYYSNFEGLLDPLPWGQGYRYYSVGSFNQDTSMQLPDYVVHPRTEYVGNNTDRIIIRVREQDTGWRVLQRVDQVYITQHIEDQGEYDPDHTYQITTNLLRQIREFAVGENQQSLYQLRNRYGSNANVSNIRITWENLAGLGLLLFVVIQERHSSNQYNNRTEYTHRPESNYRPEYTDRLQSNYRPEYNYRPQFNYTPQHNYRPENRHNDWDECAPAMCIFLLVVIVVVALFFLGNLRK